MRNTKTPCLDCKKRHLGCHAECPDYIAMRAKIDKAREAKEKLQSIDSYSIRQISVMHRSRGTAQKRSDRYVHG